HKTDGLSSSTLVLRRGQAFTVTISYDGRPFDPLKEKLIFRIVLGPLSVEVPVSRLGHSSLTQWSAVLERSIPDPTGPHALWVSLSSPASASVGVYTLQMRVETHLTVRTHLLGQFMLLCNPWCPADSVFLQSEDLRNEFVRSDFGLLFKGSLGNIVFRPWSFDQYEKGILDICMKLLQLSPQHQADIGKDLQNRNNPVYISRVISAMVNSNDDKGVLMGNWSNDYSGGVSPSQWSGSADILRKWAETQFSPVKYGQCWVFAAVMCTVMRALGIPTRVVTNFNSAHDTNRNIVIEEYYSEMGEKLPIGRDSIWNFHMWVESWMKRPDLGRGYDGWQVLDPTPQEKSAGRSLQLFLQGLCIWKTHVFFYSSPQGCAVSLQLLKAPVVGENISFNVTITNKVAVPKLLRKHVNAQNKEYNRNPTGTFWEAHGDVMIAVTIQHEISFKDYMLTEAAEDSLVNLAVVIEDVKSQERVLASEEFNIRSPSLNIQVQNEYVVINTQQVATVTFTNPFSIAVSGELIVACSGLQEKVQTRLTIQPRETMRMPINFTPRMAGAKMLYASLVLMNPSTVLHGFKTINVQAS
uniref:Protein-glutamine gamma-glutamyltransferase 2-like n=1 Tax=Sinocyclocheilus anshuiensis TaxID=1608454 RepID=A0A671PDQ7_9TELE